MNGFFLGFNKCFKFDYYDKTLKKTKNYKQFYNFLKRDINFKCYIAICFSNFFQIFKIYAKLKYLKFLTYYFNCLLHDLT